MQSIVLVALVGFVVGLGLGGWGGHELADGRAARAQLGSTRTALADAAAALGTAGEQLRTTATRTATLARQQAETASRHLAEASRHEQIIVHAARLECARDPESFRLLVDAVARANDLQSISDATRMPSGLRGGAGAGGAQRGGDDALGSADGAVGRGVPPDQRAVQSGGAGALMGE